MDDQRNAWFEQHLGGAEMPPDGDEFSFEDNPETHDKAALREQMLNLPLPISAQYNFNWQQTGTENFSLRIRRKILLSEIVGISVVAIILISISLCFIVAEGVDIQSMVNPITIVLVFILAAAVALTYYNYLPIWITFADNNILIRRSKDYKPGGKSFALQTTLIEVKEHRRRNEHGRITSISYTVKMMENKEFLPKTYTVVDTNDHQLANHLGAILCDAARIQKQIIYGEDYSGY